MMIGCGCCGAGRSALLWPRCVPPAAAATARTTGAAMMVCGLCGPPLVLNSEILFFCFSEKRKVKLGLRKRAQEKPTPARFWILDFGLALRTQNYELRTKNYEPRTTNQEL